MTTRAEYLNTIARLLGKSQVNLWYDRNEGVYSLMGTNNRVLSLGEVERLKLTHHVTFYEWIEEETPIS